MPLCGPLRSHAAPPAFPVAASSAPLRPSSRPLSLPPAPSTPPLQSGWTPLHVAAWYGHAPVVALLLATPGVDPLAKDILVRGAQRRLRGRLPAPRPSPLLQTGWTPLEWAQGYGRDAAAAVLRADPRVAAAAGGR